MNDSNQSYWLQIFPKKFFSVQKSEIVSEVNQAENTILAESEGNFELLRYFSITSLAFFLLTIAILNFAYRRNAIGNLITIGEQENAALTQSLANSLRSTLKPYLSKSQGLTKNELYNQLEIVLLQNQIAEQTKTSSRVSPLSIVAKRR